MILIDVNLLIYAVFSNSARHAGARDWLDDTLSGIEAVALPWAVLSAFVRLATNPSVATQPLTVDDALAHVEEWLDLPVVRVIGPTEAHLVVFARMLRDTKAVGNLVPDAHLAAIAIEHGCRLASTDGDFARFPDLDWFNPLGSAPPERAQGN